MANNKKAIEPTILEKLAKLTGLVGNNVIEEIKNSQDPEWSLKHVLWTIPGGCGISADEVYEVAQAIVAESGVEFDVSTLVHFDGTEYDDAKTEEEQPEPTPEEPEEEELEVEEPEPETESEPVVEETGEDAESSEGEVEDTPVVEEEKEEE